MRAILDDKCTGQRTMEEAGGGPCLRRGLNGLRKQEAKISDYILTCFFDEYSNMA